ncbi:hypothetical protein D7Y15_26190 [Corallococcus sp. AB030]|uniref:hypothetical protein n=1 Tax=Corallococcus sp. AB030 TaxID=2316716 RepID=UPI000ECAAD08|nr:hypothetical protein [Corallococcus sp. AB030]RKI08301.1 hypothetical protein D7Y15_26190 [Corallococcus sp. AB030]
MALAQRLGEAELDGSPEARTRLAEARREYLAAEHEALTALGARQALNVIEPLAASAGPVPPLPATRANRSFPTASSSPGRAATPRAAT